jgi:hypothetical protein
MAHAILISPIGYREPDQIYRIVREKSHIQGPMGSIVEWQSLKVQQYRFNLLVAIARFFEQFGLRRPVRFEPPAIAGDYDEMMESAHSGSHSYLEPYLDDASATESTGEENPIQQTDPGQSGESTGHDRGN